MRVVARESDFQILILYAYTSGGATDNLDPKVFYGLLTSPNTLKMCNVRGNFFPAGTGMTHTYIFMYIHNFDKKILFKSY